MILWPSCGRPKADSLAFSIAGRIERLYLSFSDWPVSAD